MSGPAVFSRTSSAGRERQRGTEQRRREDTASKARSRERSEPSVTARSRERSEPSVTARSRERSEPNVTARSRERSEPSVTADWTEYERSTIARSSSARPDQCAGRSLLQLPAHALRRRGGEDRVARFRGPGPPSGAGARAEPGRHRGVVPRPERGQEIRRARSEGHWAARGLRGSGARRGRPAGELPGRGAGPPRIRLGAVARSPGSGRPDR